MHTTTKFQYFGANPCHFLKCVLTLIWIRIKGITTTKTQLGGNCCSSACSMHDWWNYIQVNLFSTILFSTLNTVEVIRSSLAGHIVQLSTSDYLSSACLVQRCLILSANYRPVLSADWCWSFLMNARMSGIWMGFIWSLSTRPKCTYKHTHPHTSTPSDTHPCWKMSPWDSYISLCSTNSLGLVCRKKSSVSICWTQLCRSTVF